jgi:hypothetical protein
MSVLLAEALITAGRALGQSTAEMYAGEGLIGATTTTLFGESEKNSSIISKFLYGMALPDGYEKGDVESMDTNLKIVMSTILPQLKLLTGVEKDPTWDDLLGVMNQNPLLKKSDEKSVFDIRSKEIRAYMNVIASTDHRCNHRRDLEISYFKEWFVTTAGEIDPEIAKLVVHDKSFDDILTSCYTVGENYHWNRLSTVWKNSTYDSMTLIDIGAIRVPSPESPNVKVFRVRIKVWKQSEVLLFGDHLKFGMTFEINSQVFEPIHEVLDRMQNNHILTQIDINNVVDYINNYYLTLTESSEEN